jgi:carbon starvation protein
MLVRMGKEKYAWVTAAPGIFLAFVTMYAGYLNITVIYLPKGMYLLAILATIVMAMMLIVIAGAFKRWNELLKIKERVKDIWGDTVITPIEGEACALPVNPELTTQERQAAEKWG